jgi:hypothetical protein
VIGLGRPVVDGSFFLSGLSSRISDVEIDADGGYEALNLSGGAGADRILAISASVDGCVVQSSGGTITNSLCISERSSFYSALSTQLASSGSGAVTAHNLTMIGYYGLYANSPTDPALTISDSIAKSTDPGSGEDADFSQGMTFATRCYLLEQSSPENVTETEPLTQEPIFRGPGDYREAADSPTIDAGSTTAAPGELDLDGNLRKIGARTDVGAYEFVPAAPSVADLAATATSTTSATVDATIDPNSGQTYYHLEYGPSAAYGNSTPTVIMPAASTASGVHLDLSGLVPNSTVHYSIVATSDGGTTTTPDATFGATPPTPPSTSVPSTPTPLSSPKKLAPTLRFKNEKSGTPKGQPLLDRPAIKLSTGCGPVACNVSVQGKVAIGGKSFGILPGPKKATHWQAGKQGAIRLTSAPRLQRRVRGYLQANPGARAKILVIATFVAADGSRAIRKLTIPVRPL